MDIEKKKKRETNKGKIVVWIITPDQMLQV